MENDKTAPMMIDQPAVVETCQRCLGDIEHGQPAEGSGMWGAFHSNPSHCVSYRNKLLDDMRRMRDEASQEATRLREAAEALLDAWETVDWPEVKRQRDRLREALAAHHKEG